jgi:hypothetical protein
VLDFEDGREFGHHGDAGVVDGPLQGADIGAIHARFVRQRLLGKVSLPPVSPQIGISRLAASYGLDSRCSLKLPALAGRLQGYYSSRRSDDPSSARLRESA